MDLEARRALIMAWSPEELPSVKRIEIGPRVLGYFEGTSAWHGEMVDSDGFDLLLDAVFDVIRRAPRGKDGAVRLDLSTRQVEAVLYYADVMRDATDPANTGDDDRSEFAAAERLLGQIAKKWPEASL